MPKKYTIAAHATIVLSTIKERPFQALFLAANFINFTTQKNTVLAPCLQL